MVLATRCPHCETVFRVQDALLARTHGRVRCGHCQEVFDASQNLLGPAAEPERAADHPPAEAVSTPQTQDSPVATPAPAEATPAHAPESEADVESAAAAPELGSSEPPLESPLESPTESPTETAIEIPATGVHIATAQAGHETLNGHRINSVSHEATRDEPREPTLPHRPEPFAEQRETAPQHEVPYETRHRAVPHRAEPEPSSPPPDDEPHFAPREPAVPRWEPDPEPSFRVPPQAESEPPQSAAASEGFRMPPASPADEGAHFAVTRERRASAPRHLLRGVFGTLLCLILAVLLAAQLAWWQRETVMVYWPGSQPLFARVCAQFGCLISPPRDIDGLQVEASDLRQIDGPHKLELRVPLRNRYSVALAYPAIELTLFDAKNEVAIRRVLWPQDYLPPGTTLANGLPPRTSQTMIVRLDSGNAVATNFRVQIFYP